MTVAHCSRSSPRSHYVDKSRGITQTELVVQFRLRVHVKRFLITGVSKGLGRAFAVRALSAGHSVVGTVRAAGQAAEFEAIAPGRAVAEGLDVTNVDAVGGLGRHEPDVLIVNAGYGHEGTFEESTMEDLRRQFDVNVFGAVATMKAVLPGMRARRRGHILVVTSVGGLVAFPGLSFYNGS